MNMSYAVHIYVDAAGNTYSASQTDQHHTQSTERTVRGNVVAYAGKWFGSQMSYRPYRDAIGIARAAAIAHDQQKDSGHT